MCLQCDYQALLREAGLSATRNRIRILEVIGSNSSPLTAGEIFEILSRSSAINRVTVYRVLDLLVENRLVERLSTGGRSFHFGLAPNAQHPAHPHFYCTVCGQMVCLQPEFLTLDTERISRNLAGEIQKIEVRIDGICRSCLRKKKASEDQTAKQL